MFISRIFSDETISKHRFLVLYCLIVLWTTVLVVLLATNQDYGSWGYPTMLIYFALPSFVILAFVVRYNLKISQQPHGRGRFFAVLGSFLIGFVWFMMFSSVWISWMFSSLTYDARLVITAILNLCYGVLTAAMGFLGLMYTLKEDRRHIVAGILFLFFGIIYSFASLSFVNRFILESALYAALITLGVLIVFYMARVIKIPTSFEQLTKVIPPAPARAAPVVEKQRPNKRYSAKPLQPAPPAPPAAKRAAIERTQKPLFDYESEEACPRCRYEFTQYAAIEAKQKFVEVSCPRCRHTFRKPIAKKRRR